ncbi:ABC transporter ATP-binding protein [Desulfitobacterium chlororespirans]|uniref:ATP-binding cassette, subfamily B n=1 Tax=Desulfitobacterium chlororespirans DSM 11544 TaxID=1121395 RepID=A0A1M7TVU7_9FIRM|nr:ABC transporter ATP-binding protein [Desulfitobacterium chlororespirans]SHN74847.1 ATP-binding cassette, subfamily B [Desulfitobacterium chlororespirans DSM 11544]
MSKKNKAGHSYSKRGKAPEILTAVSVLAGIASTLIAVYLITLLWEGKPLGALLIPTLGIALCQIIKGGFYALALWQAHEFAYSSLLTIRNGLIDKLKRLPLSFFQKHKTGELAGIVDHDVERVELYLAHTLPEVAVTGLVCGLSGVAVFILDWRMGLALIATVPLVVIILAVSSPFWKGAINDYQDSTRTVSENIMEYIATIPVIKVFAAGERKTEKVLASMDDYIGKARKAIYVQAAPMGLITVLVEGGVVLVAIVGAYILKAGPLTSSDITRFILAFILAQQFTGSLIKATTLMYNKAVYDNTMKSVERIMGEPVREQPRSGAPAVAGDIVFDQAGFSYDGTAEALTDISLIFRQNTTSAIVGPSGAGKSTIAGLLLGLWRHETGSITIAGRRIEDIPEAELTALISVVQQDNFLLNISIEENLRIGKPDATEAEIRDAAQKAQIHETIMRLPGGYQTIPGEGGVRLSGGEKQRISLARMMLKNAPIVILDEATAAVDPYNESLIHKAISELCENKTLIVIAHHLNTIAGADQIVVMNRGRVEAVGKHGELVESCSLYRSMVEAQQQAQNWNIKEAAV